MSKSIPPAPARSRPDPSGEHAELYSSVREAVQSLPIHFRTETLISGIMATDLHTLNTVLGATIEEQVVRTLNLTRRIWDPRERYALYQFVRQPQTFPDVRLQRTAGQDVLMGLEMKGWYLLAKEAEPSLRLQVTAAACTPQDLIVVVPWVLGNVISGSPMLFEPWIESARYAAEFRNHHWQHVRRTDSDTAILVPPGAAPYPSKSDPILDKPGYDGGGNFGRLARTGIMDDYMRTLEILPLCGIRITYWRQFLRTFQESTTEEEARLALQRLRDRIRAEVSPTSPKAEAALAILAQVEALIGLDPALEQ